MLPMRNARISRRKHSRGVSLIELLVAVLVMGIGVLGITGLQLVSLQNNRSALMRAEAVQLAYDMMDRVRANPTGTPLGLPYSGFDLTDAPPAITDCYANNCSEADMVTFDQAVWKCSLGGFNADSECVDMRTDGLLPPIDEQPGLPDGDGSIAVDNVTGVVTVVVEWTAQDGSTQTITINSRT